MPDHSFERIKAERDAINFYDEHTFGAAESISDPRTENSVVQWGEKGSYVWEAFKAGRMLREDGLGLLQSVIPLPEMSSILVFNSQGFQRDGIVELFIDKQILPSEKPFKIIAPDGSELKTQLISKRSEGCYWAIQVRNIPAFAWQILQIQKGKGSITGNQSLNSSIVLENEYYRIRLDSLKTGIASIYDKNLDMELVDAHSENKLGEFIYERLGKNREQLSNFRLEEFTRNSWKEVTVKETKDGPLWQSIILNGKCDDCADASGVNCEIRLYKLQKKIELRYSMKKLPQVDPEGVYIAFPFVLKNGQPAFESQGGIVIPVKISSRERLQTGMECRILLPFVQRKSSDFVKLPGDSSYDVWRI